MVTLRGVGYSILEGKIIMMFPNTCVAKGSKDGRELKTHQKKKKKRRKIRKERICAKQMLEIKLNTIKCKCYILIKFYMVSFWILKIKLN